MLSVHNLVPDLKAWLGAWGETLWHCDSEWGWVDGQVSMRTGVCVISDGSQMLHGQVWQESRCFSFWDSPPTLKELLRFHEIRLPLGRMLAAQLLGPDSTIV